MSDICLDRVVNSRQMEVRTDMDHVVVTQNTPVNINVYK